MAFNGFNRIVPPPVQPKDLKVDMVLCTHNHIDHLDEETLMYTDYSSFIYSGPDTCVSKFKTLNIPAERIIALNRGGSINLGDAVIHGVFAAHTEDSIGVVIEYKGLITYLTGDSLLDKKLLDIKRFKPDILICCINGKLGNMNCSEAAWLARELEVRTAVPCHYGMFNENTEDPQNFRKSLEGSNIKYIELKLNQVCPIHKVLELIKGGEIFHDKEK